MIRNTTLNMGWMALAMVVLGGFGTKAYAYTPGACRQDSDKLCPGLADKEAIPCLKQHEAELSTACKVNLAEARQMVREAKDACEPDIKKFCADVQQGEGRIRRCLKSHEAELSEGCKTTIAKAKQKIQTGTSTPAPADKAAPETK
jgi:hypothetical protein